jgi:hypothetical protein
LTIEEYQKIVDKHESIVDLLGMPNADEIEFDPPRLGGSLHRAADLS